MTLLGFIAVDRRVVETRPAGCKPAVLPLSLAALNFLSERRESNTLNRFPKPGDTQYPTPRKIWVIGGD